jgi:protoporphyrinogen oxidase
VLFGLGFGTSARVLLSYCRVALRPVRPEVSFADWVTNRFGRCLYRIFFETYTEKVWGIPPSTIGAQWAAQRIKGLSLVSAVRHMLFPPRDKGSTRTLIEEFDYPRLGPGMMWEAVADRVTAGGGHMRMRAGVTEVGHANGRVESVSVDTADGPATLPAGHLISTMAIRDFVRALRPEPPPEVLAAANRLKYRDFLTVALILDVADLFPDNWIYVHDPEGDGLWSMPDADLVALATRELATLGLADPAQVREGVVVRARKAYPVYDEGFEEALRLVRAYLDTFENLQLVGRNGMHKYNNQDHSMLTAILAVRNVYGERHDLWALNSDDEYGEEIGAEPDTIETAGAGIGEVSATQPRVPRPVSAARGR